MWTRIAAGLVVAAVGVMLLPDRAISQAGAQDKGKINPPKHLYGHDLRVRKGGDKDFSPETPRIGVEFFLDENTKTVIALSETGAISVTEAPVGSALGTDRTGAWKYAHDLACRKAGEADFKQGTKKWGVELFQDRATNRLLYVCESGSIALAKVPAELITTGGPKWHHALEPKVRAPDQVTFESARKFGMEIFKDENTGTLLYITEVGAIASASSKSPTPDPKKILPPKAVYGLDLRVRGAEEPDFTDKTKRMGVEVFEDPNTELLFYMTDAGYLATAPFKGKFVPNATSVTWKSAMALRARKGGEKEFDKAKKYGIEVFEDNRTGNLLFLSETGSIAVLPK
jgi:hypothetical protein